ncbi:conserved phage C-terminal domain-containing protein [Priestia megaterium]|uniref:conserved phage C-terminal domain-containing protein n=1 Tax=Priestia megaterium TaxID=1404 RepID=UPI00263A8C71|nr:conserved phage C-terminal domain-containing protein [Priestia megaterium]MDN4862803.1 conserved phage C-terminal domain-containing protein [Priestia megaterium]
MEIICFLNKIANKNFYSSPKLTRSLIKKRWNDGFVSEDFKYVIKVKGTEYLDSQYENYLRPTTLFVNKFEGYLNQQVHFSKKLENQEALRKEVLKVDEESRSDR